MKKEETVQGGVNFLELLFLLFLGLKLAGLITWSWWWVFAPIWAPIALILLVLGVAALYVVLANAVDKTKTKKINK